jgi:hypothetical protein
MREQLTTVVQIYKALNGGFSPDPPPAPGEGQGPLTVPSPPARLRRPPGPPDPVHAREQSTAEPRPEARAIIAASGDGAPSRA